MAQQSAAPMALTPPPPLLRRAALAPFALLQALYYATLHRLYVFYCAVLRPFPIPGGTEVRPAPRDSDRRRRARRERKDVGSNRLGSCSGVGGSCQTILDGSQIAHNTHLTCIRNTVRPPAAGTNGGDDGDAGGGGGFFLVPEEGEEESASNALPHGVSGGAADAVADAANAGVIFASLDEALLHAHRTSLLLVVYLHSEASATSVTLLREIIVHNTANIQRFLSNNVAFYLMSASSPEAAGLLQTVAMGQAFPAVFVFNANQRRRGGGGFSTKSNAAAGDAVPPASALRFVSSMEGVGCAADLHSYLRECEKRYMSWL